MVLLPFINMSQCSEETDLELKSSLALTLTSLTLFLTFSIHDFLRISSTFFDHVAESDTDSRAARETEPVPPEEPWGKKAHFYLIRFGFYFGTPSPGIENTSALQSVFCWVTSGLQKSLMLSPAFSGHVISPSVFLKTFPFFKCPCGTKQDLASSR